MEEGEIERVIWSEKRDEARKRRERDKRETGEGKDGVNNER
jgi:hypothetical protein